MGTKLQPKKGAKNKLKRKIHLKTHTVVVGLKVVLEEARRLVERKSLHMIMQMMFLVQKHQMLEEMLIDLAQIMNQIERQQLRNLTEVLEK